MSNYSKNYIGKGRQHETLKIVTVTLSVEDFEKHIYEYKGEKFLSFQLAELKEPDQYGKTHTAFISVKDQEEEIITPKPNSKPRKKTAAKK